MPQLRPTISICGNCGSGPMSIYLEITPDDLERMAPLLNLFFQQVVDLNTRELPEQNPKLNQQGAAAAR